MTRSEINLIRRALALLHKLVPDDEPRASGPKPQPCPVIQFAKRSLVRQPGADMSSADLWTFYKEIAGAGEPSRNSCGHCLGPWRRSLG